MNPHEVLKRVLADITPDHEHGYEFGWESLRPTDGTSLTGDMVFITLARELNFSIRYETV